MIIIEGCDGVGKTTLATELMKVSEKYNLGYIYIKENTPKNGFAYYMQETVKQNRLQIRDRFHLGESVYPQIKKDGRRPLDDQEQALLDLALKASGSLLVACSASMEFIRRSFKERGETYITIEDVPRILDSFTLRFQKCLLPTEYRIQTVNPISSYDPGEWASTIISRHQKILKILESLRKLN